MCLGYIVLCISGYVVLDLMVGFEWFVYIVRACFCLVFDGVFTLFTVARCVFLGIRLVGFAVFDVVMNVILLANSVAILLVFCVYECFV